MLARARRLLDAVRGALAPEPVKPDYNIRRARRIEHLEPDVRVSTIWTPRDLRAAQIMADGGNLSRAADLCEAILGDDRASAVLNTRVNAVLGSELSFEAGRGRRKRAAVKALEAGEDWYAAFDEPVIGQLLLWGRLLGVSLAQKNWREFPDHGNRTIPVAANYHARFLRWDPRERGWRITVGDYGTEVPATPGDAKWIIFMPYGQNRPWAHGLWRGMARWWLLKQYAIDDWGRHSELHGHGMKVAKPPPNSGSTFHGMKRLRQELADDIAAMASDSTIVLPPDFDFELVEAQAKTWEMFKAQIDMANAAFSIQALGSNLPTEVGDGAQTGATAQTLVRLEYKKGDAEVLSTMAHDQSLVGWAEFNFGDGGLAAWPVWDVEPPADLKARAELLLTFGNAIDKLTESNVPIDIPKLGEEFNIPMREVEETLLAQAPRVYEYHLKYGIMTRDEVRQTLRLPRAPGGETIPQPVGEVGGTRPDRPDEQTMAALAVKAALAGVAVEKLATVWARGAEGRGDDAPLWAMGRVNAYLARAAGGDDYGEDYDLKEES